MSILDKDSMMEDHWGDRELVVNTHNLAVHELYHRMKPLIEGADSPVVMNTMMILLAMMGKQSDMDPEHFKAFVVMELDRLMAIVEVEDE
jgi:hypothetical protein